MDKRHSEIRWWGWTVGTVGRWRWTEGTVREGGEGKLLWGTTSLQPNFDGT